MSVARTMGSAFWWICMEETWPTSRRGWNLKRSKTRYLTRCESISHDVFCCID